jgi:hypothetical protein
VFPPAHPTKIPSPDEIDLVPTEPVVGEPLVGYRAWKVVRRRGLLGLSSVYHPTFWPHRRRVTAVCLGGSGRRWEQKIPHRAPSPLWRDGNGGMRNACVSGMACGVYACTSLELLQREQSYKGALESGLGRAFGPVKLWGVVVPYVRGYRAQYAYPGEPLVYRPSTGVLLDGSAEEIADELSDAYGVEVMVDVGDA